MADRRRSQGDVPTVLEGTIAVKQERGIKGFRQWKTRYGVLNALCLYIFRSKTDLSLITLVKVDKIVQVELFSEKTGGTRFDIRYYRSLDSPRGRSASVVPATVTGSPEFSRLSMDARIMHTLCFRASSTEEAQEWCGTISNLVTNLRSKICTPEKPLFTQSLKGPSLELRRGTVTVLSGTPSATKPVPSLRPSPRAPSPIVLSSDSSPSKMRKESRKGSLPTELSLTLGPEMIETLKMSAAGAGDAPDWPLKTMFLEYFRKSGSFGGSSPSLLLDLSLRRSSQASSGPSAPSSGLSSPKLGPSESDSSGLSKKLLLHGSTTKAMFLKEAKEKADVGNLIGFLEDIDDNLEFIHMVYRFAFERDIRDAGAIVKTPTSFVSAPASTEEAPTESSVPVRKRSKRGGTFDFKMAVGHDSATVEIEKDESVSILESYGKREAFRIRRADAQNQFLELVKTTDIQPCLAEAFGKYSSFIDAYLLALAWEILQIRTRRSHLCNEFILNLDDFKKEKFQCKYCEESQKYISFATQKPLSSPVLQVFLQLLTIGKWSPEGSTEIAMNNKISTPSLFKSLLSAASVTPYDFETVTKCLTELNALLIDSFDNACVIAMRENWIQPIVALIMMKFPDKSELDEKDLEEVQRIPKLAINLIVLINFHFMKIDGTWMQMILLETISDLLKYCSSKEATQVMESIINQIFSRKPILFFSISSGMTKVENLVTFMDIVCDYMFKDGKIHVIENKCVDKSLAHRCEDLIDAAHVADNAVPHDAKDAKILKVSIEKLALLKNFFRDVVALFTFLEGIFATRASPDSKEIEVSPAELEMPLRKFLISKSESNAATARRLRREILESLSKALS